MLVGLAGRAEGVGEVDEFGCGLRPVVQEGAQPFGLCPQGGRTPAGHRERQRAGGGPPGGGGVRGLLGGGVGGDVGGGFLQDDVGVGAADAEGGDGRPAGVFTGFPGLLAGEQLDASGGPVDVRGGDVGVQGAGQHAVVHRQHHLDHAGGPGGGLGVADVGLQRTEPQRTVPVAAVGGQQRLRLDGVAQRGAGAVRLDDVDLVGRQPGVVERGADDAFLGGTAGGGETVGGSVLVDGAATDHGEHGVSVAAGVGEPLDEQDADTLAPAGAVRVGGERLATAVGGQPALTAELVEGDRVRHDGDAADEGHGAVTGADGLGGQVQSGQRRGARGVHTDGGPPQAQCVGDTAGEDGGGAAGELVALGSGHARLHVDAVALAVGPDEHARTGAAQRPGVDAGSLHRLPDRFQDQPLLRVHGQRLARVDAEEGGVEHARVVQEAALGRLGGRRALRAHQRAVVPAPVAGERGDGVAARGEEPPEVLG